jgi:dethiobiotin synthetase
MNSRAIFITGTGTGVGKTVAAAILAEATGAAYWKPVQAGYAEGTDSEWVRQMLSGKSKVFPETYKLKLAASPHIAAREENIRIDSDKIHEHYRNLLNSPELYPLDNLDHPAPEFRLIIEGAGGLHVPLNESEFVKDLIKKLDIPVIIVSRNYLGSINHSLLTAKSLASEGIRVNGWIFNDNFMKYEKEIAAWSGYPILFYIPQTGKIDKNFIRLQAARVREILLKKL